MTHTRMSQKNTQGTTYVMRVCFPDRSVRSFQVPANYKLREISQYLIKEKLDFGQLALGKEFIFSNLNEDDLELMDQECTPVQISDALGGRVNFYFRKMFYLRDAKKFNPSVQLCPFDTFMLGQLEQDFLDSRVIYPVKYTVMLTTLLIADRYGAFDPQKHRQVLENIGEYLPKWTDDIADWPRKKTTGMDIQYYFQEFAEMDSENFDMLFAQEVQKQWEDFSGLYNPEEVSLKAKAKFMEFVVSPEFELYSQIQVFKTRYSGRQDELAGDLYFGIGPLGIHFFDKEGLFLKYGYHYHCILTTQVTGRRLFIKTDDEMEHVFDLREAKQAQWLIENYMKILNQMGEEDELAMQQTGF